MTPLTRRRLANFKANRRGFWSFWIFLVLFVVSLGAEFIANDKPLLIEYENHYYWPVFHTYPETTFGGEFETETDYRDPYVRDLINRTTDIQFKPTGQVDSYGRDLGLVSLNGMDLGDDLYQHGMAARLTDPRFDWCQPISQKAEGAPPISAVVNLAQ